MTARVAALYDIHGNAHALDAVLAEVERAGVDLILIGGDVAWGPQPRPVLARLRSLGARAAHIRGNADREVAQGVPHDADDVVVAVTAWVHEQLTPAERDDLLCLPETAVVDVDGIGEVLFCHGSPRSDEESITTATPDEQLAAMLGDTDAATIVCGHTHAQFDRRLGRRRIVNAGSVGLPFGEPGAYWALLGPGVVLCRTPYDVAAAARAVLASGVPGARDFADHISTPPPAARAAEIFTQG